MSWKILSRNEVRGCPLPRGSTQFGVFVYGASMIPIYDDKKVVHYRTFLPRPNFETGEENIFKLNRNKGNCLQRNSHSNF
jgi:hypothetical protein